MKTTIFSSFALGALVSLFACQSPSGNNTNTDSTGAIRQEPANPEANRDMSRDTAMSAQGTLDDRTRSFMNDAAMGGMAEVELGKLAQQNASSQRVKNFGEMMVRDHSAANDDLKSIAGKKNVTLPDNIGKHQEHKDDLSKKKGADFDKAYMKMMVEDHKDDIDAFEKIANNSNDPDVKTFASQKLPTLRKHLASAKAINESLGKMNKKY